MLNDPLQAGFEKVDLVGFAIRRPGPEQYHVGLLYKVPGKPVRLRHQCDHLDIRDKEPDNPEYLWTDVAALSSLNKRLIANKMSRAGGDKVPYGVGFRAGCGQLLMYRYFGNSILIDLLPELFPPGFREHERTQA
jgi:hypothetical protein